MKSRTWSRWAGRLARWVLLPWLVLRILAVVAFRTQYRPVIDAVRAFNRRLLNPAMLRLAGRRGWYAARLEHVGRRTGRRYATPVWAERTPDGFVIPLPYGVDVDWRRNLQAAGSGVIADDGEAYVVGNPEVVEAAAALPLLPPRIRRLFQLYGIGHYVTVKILPEPRPGSASRVVPMAEAGPAPAVGAVPDGAHEARTRGQTSEIAGP